MAGWPWPLDGVQGWFEGLWTWIGDAATNAVSAAQGWINDSMAWLWNQIGGVSGWIVEQIEGFVKGVSTAVSTLSSTVVSKIAAAVSSMSTGVQDVGSWLYTQITSGLQGLVTNLSNLASGLGSQISSLISQAASSLQNIGGWLTNTIWGGVDGALRWASDSFRWLQTQIAETGSYVVDQVSKAFDGAFTAIGDAIGSIFGPALSSFNTFTSTFSNMLLVIDIPSHLEDINAVRADVVKAVTAPLTEHSPLEPEKAWELSRKLTSGADMMWEQLYRVSLILEGISLGQLETPGFQIFGRPSTAAMMSTAAELWRIQQEAFIYIPVKQFWMKAFTPMIPPSPDLIRMVVREAFVEEMVIKAPDVFAEYMELSGFSREWSDRYWTAHFEPIALTQAYSNLWRGYWDKDQFLYALHIADVHPMWRDDIYSVAYRPLTRRELRYGWETGIIGPDKMIEAFRAMGLTLEDAEIAAEAAMEYALHEERMGVLTEWRSDFQEGLIDEDTFRANMESIKILGIRQDYYISRATIRRERYRMRDLLDLYRDGFMKDIVTEEELRDRVHEIVVIPEVADLFVEKAYVDKWKKPQPPRETEEEKALKELQKYQITYAIQAYRKYAVEKAELTEMLVAAGVDPAVAATRTDYEELKRPIPKPTADEVTRAREETRAQRLHERTAVEEFRGDVIDADGLYKRLIEIGYGEVLATALTQLEVIKKVS